jgi:hypothetical protein
MEAGQIPWIDRPAGQLPMRYAERVEPQLDCTPNRRYEGWSQAAINVGFAWQGTSAQLQTLLSHRLAAWHIRLVPAGTGPSSNAGTYMLSLDGTVSGHSVFIEVDSGVPMTPGGTWKARIETPSLGPQAGPTCG